MKWYVGKKVLITGGAGFIGSHLTENLVKAGACVTVIDDLSTGNHDNLAHIQKPFSFVEGDIRDKQTCTRVVYNKDVIFHLAAFVSVPESLEKPELCNAINITGTQNLSDAAAEAGVSSFVFSSSSAVYGEQTQTCKESGPLHPQSPYAHSKLTGEQICLQLARTSTISTVSLRYFNVFGSRQNPNGHYAAVVAKFKQSLHSGKPILIFGDGMQTRDFVPVSRVVQANLCAGMQSGMRGEVFNVATGQSINLHSLLSRLENESGLKHTKICYQPARAGDVKSSAADCTKLEQMLQRSLFRLN